ncbi:hypothetical protein LTR62_008446 [Meristemomyces frigidus]|uniref:Uncharacterized protein n=1 Tax=Meristemomyces frigidus TaxID=1508187 RepID=A0AAN7YR05_9PEZI|nr:hypothetical protein LTR62_008446 [Meristemomyces frigidus]
MADFRTGDEVPHFNGFRVIMAARPVDAHLSDFGHYLIWQSIDKEFITACGLGRASGWDEDRWDALRFSTPGSSSELGALQGLMTRLAVKVPNLIAEMRLIRERTKPTISDLQVVLQLVQQLLLLEDADAESQVLHQVKIVPSGMTTKRVVMASSYTFRSYDQSVALIHYWYLRLIVIKLRLDLDQTHRKQFESALFVRTSRPEYICRVIREV